MFSCSGNLEPSIITELKPSSIQALQISKSSPWSKWSTMSKPVSSIAASTNFFKYMGLAYFLAPADTCNITGAFSCWAAATMPWIISILLTLNAPTA